MEENWREGPPFQPSLINKRSAHACECEDRRSSNSVWYKFTAQLKAEINYEWKFSSEETAACLKEAVEEIVEVHQRCSLTSPLQ